MSFWELIGVSANPPMRELTMNLQPDPKVRKQFGNKPDPQLVDTYRNVSGGG